MYWTVAILICNTYHLGLLSCQKHKFALLREHGLIIIVGPSSRRWCGYHHHGGKKSQWRKPHSPRWKSSQRWWESYHSRPQHLTKCETMIVEAATATRLEPELDSNRPTKVVCSKASPRTLSRADTTWCWRRRMLLKQQRIRRLQWSRPWQNLWRDMPSSLTTLSWKKQQQPSCPNHRRTWWCSSISCKCGCASCIENRQLLVQTYLSQHESYLSHH